MSKRHPHTEETKRKMSLTRTGMKRPDMIGKKYHLGFKHTEETKQKIRECRRGVPLSIEHRKKIGSAQIGEKHHAWKGGVSKNKEYLKEKNRKWKLENKDKVGFNIKKRRALRIGAVGSHTLGEWEILKKQYGFTCPCCKKVEPNIKLTEDHIVPLTKGGSNFIENIQPLCQSCNSHKRTQVMKFLNDKFGTDFIEEYTEEVK